MKFDLGSIKKNLMIKYPLFGSVLANTKFVEDDSVITAGTDGDVIYYSSAFLDGLNEKEQTFILAHEVCHIAFNHIFRSEGKDKGVWNKATDAVINALLKEDGLPLVGGGVDIPDAINYNAEQMYELLLEKKQDKLQANESSNNKQNSNQEEQSEFSAENNSHDMWERAVEKRKSKDGGLQEEKKREEHIKKLASVGEVKSFEKNKIARKKQLEELMDSIADESHGVSAVTNSEIRDARDIGVASPLIDWRRLLKEAIKLETDWSYENATVEEGVVTANLEEMPKPETEIVLDTSGSVDTNLLRNFLRECKNILQTSKVKVGCFDTEFYGFKEIRNIRDIDNMKFQGGGGTNFDVAVSAFTRRVENKIIFTDGYARMPSRSIDAIWVVFGNGKIQPKGGKVLYINEEQLKKMSSIAKRR